MTTSYTASAGRPRGVVGALKLALRIALGGGRLLWRYPKLVLPLVPIFVLVLGTMLSLLFIQSFVLQLLVVFAVAYALMFSFAITSHMLNQIENGGRPSILAALSSSGTVRMIPRVFALSVIWYVLVFILVVVETALRGLLGRINERLADAAVAFIFGAVADALRMAGFMLVAIMTFEDIGLRPATGRLRQVVSGNPITILGGLALTKAVALLSVLAVMVLPESLGRFLLIPLAVLWILGMYLEQIFVTGLYLYATRPDSRIVEILLQDFLSRELPQLPRALAEQPAA